MMIMKRKKKSLHPLIPSQTIAKHKQKNKKKQKSETKISHYHFEDSFLCNINIIV